MASSECAAVPAPVAAGLWAQGPVKLHAIAVDSTATTACLDFIFHFPSYSSSQLVFSFYNLQFTTSQDPAMHANGARLVSEQSGFHESGQATCTVDVDVDAIIATALAQFRCVKADTNTKTLILQQYLLQPKWCGVCCGHCHEQASEPRVKRSNPPEHHQTSSMA